MQYAYCTICNVAIFGTPLEETEATHLESEMHESSIQDPNSAQSIDANMLHLPNSHFIVNTMRNGVVVENEYICLRCSTGLNSFSKVDRHCKSKINCIFQLNKSSV